MRHLARHYRSGQRYRERINAGVFAPAPGEAIGWETGMLIHFPPLADSDGDWGGSSFGSAADSRSTKLFRDGELVEEYDDRFGFANPIELISEPATFKLVSTLDRHSVSRFSTKVEHVWTFRSGGSQPEVWRLPLLAVKYRSVVNLRNVTLRKPVTRLPVEIVGQKGTALPEIAQFTVEYQGAAGSAWQPVKLVRAGAGKYVAEFPTPAGDVVSLRAKVVDGDGNSMSRRWWTRSGFN